MALIAIAISARLSQQRLIVAGTNDGPGTATGLKVDTRVCQQGEALPADTSAIRIWAEANAGPRIAVAILAHSRTVSTGTVAAGWIGRQVTIPIEPLPHRLNNASVCVTRGPAVEQIGVGAPAATSATPKVRIEYMRPDRRSWWSLLPTVARHMGLGRSPSGTWIAIVPLVLMIAAAILAAGLVTGQLGLTPQADECASARGQRTRLPGRILREVPSAAYLCACVAVLNAASWSVLTPPFEAPDEPAHVAYVQHLAEDGTRPDSGGAISAEEATVFAALNPQPVMLNPAFGTIASPAAQSYLDSVLDQPLSRGGEGAGVAGSQPPLYYALQTVPYLVASRGNLLERLALMRLLSALMAGGSALFVFLFLREALARTRWAWTVGGLGIALFPLLGFMSGVVNPDSMLCTVSAALFFLLARAFRRGLTAPIAIAIGVVVAVGLLTKLNFVGLVPGVVLALVILTRRTAQSVGRSALWLPALSVAIGGLPLYAYAAINLASHHPTLGLLSTNAHATSGRGSPLDELAYIWQLYLPRLPGMPHDFPGLSPLRAIWFDRTIGLYGWLDTYFPRWVDNVALIPTAAIAALCTGELLRHRKDLRARLPELAVYGAMAAGLLTLIGADSYLWFPQRAGGYGEPRYLLPLVALLGAVLALAARGAGSRWGPIVGASIVVLILGHDIFSELLTVSRFYG